MDNKPDRKPLHCYDCNLPTPSYMVRDEVWLEAWPDYPSLKAALRKEHGDNALRFLLLCLPCLEKRLGRKLVVEDFDLTLPINQGIAYGMKLTSRKSRADFDQMLEAGRRTARMVLEGKIKAPPVPRLCYEGGRAYTAKDTSESCGVWVAHDEDGREYRPDGVGRRR